MQHDLADVLRIRCGSPPRRPGMPGTTPARSSERSSTPHDLVGRQPAIDAVGLGSRARTYRRSRRAPVRFLRMKRRSICSCPIPDARPRRRVEDLPTPIGQWRPPGRRMHRRRHADQISVDARGWSLRPERPRLRLSETRTDRERDPPHAHDCVGWRKLTGTSRSHTVSGSRIRQVLHVHGEVHPITRRRLGRHRRVWRRRSS